MEKENLIKKLSEALILEETTLMAELNQALSFIDGSDFDSDKKSEIRKKINYLIEDSAEHAGLVAKLIKKVSASNETDF